MDNGNLDNIVLALLFSAEEPLSVRKITAITEGVSASDVKDAVERWRKRLDDEAWSIVLEKVAGGYQLSSRPEYAAFIARLYSGRRKLRLSKAALETLAIIAYKQPITRAEIENVRGVGCGGVVGNLMERGLIKITGKAKVLGSPFLYGTTPEFLEYLGLYSLKDLPSAEELEALLEREEQAVTEARPEETIELEFSADDDSVEVDDDDVTDELSEELEAEGAESPEEPVEETHEETVLEAVAPEAAVIGPDLDEPYHRPVSPDPETTDPIWTEIATTTGPLPPEPGDTDPAEEDTGEKRWRKDTSDEHEDRD
jgi:segregation and condensation protein B